MQERYSSIRLRRRRDEGRQEFLKNRRSAEWAIDRSGRGEPSDWDRLSFEEKIREKFSNLVI